MGSTVRWRSILLTLSDSAFFDILRNYVGEVKTPYNKHELIGRLESFLLNAEHQKLILSLIDSTDRQILEAVDVLDDPTHDMLFAYLHRDFSYVDLHHRLLNLEDRLLIYRDPEEKTICLNPLLAPALRETALRLDILYPGYPVGGEDTGEIIDEIPWLNDALVIAFVSFLLSNPELFRTDGSLRKKSEEELRTTFPPLFIEQPGSIRRLELLIATLTALGIVVRTDSALLPDIRQLKRLAAMARRERHELYWLAAVFRSAGLAAEHLNYLQSLEASLGGGIAFAPRTMERLCSAVYLRIMRTNLPADFSRTADDFGSLTIPATDEFSSGESETASDAFGYLISGLRRLGFLVDTENSDLALNPRIEELYAERSFDEEPALILQPTFSVTTKPWIPLDTGLSIAFAAEIRMFDLYPQYEITKTSFGRALAEGYDSVELRFTFEALTGKPLPQNVAFSLETWAGEYASITLHEGVVLVADEKRRFLVEHSERLASYIRKTLAPGVYLLDPRERPQWEAVLEAEGIDMLPRASLAHSSDVALPSRLPATSSGAAGERGERERARGAPVNLELFPHEDDQTGAQQLPDPAEVERTLLSTLDALDISRDKKEEIGERIKRKLIVHPDQISPHITRGERIEAKGLDYTGKVRLIEQVLKDQREGRMGEYLEIVRRTSKGAPSRLLVRPAELVHAGTQLILSGYAIPDEREVKISVSKMVLVRKMKGTLFG